MLYHKQRLKLDSRNGYPQDLQAKPSGHLLSPNLPGQCTDLAIPQAHPVPIQVTGPSSWLSCPESWLLFARV